MQNAVLGAAAGLQRHDALDLDLRAAPRHPDLVSQLQQLRQIVVGQAQHLKDLGLVKAGTVCEHPGAGTVEDLGHCRTLQVAADRNPAPPGLSGRGGSLPI